MSNSNPNGRWEFDEHGNSRYVPPNGQQSPYRTDGYRSYQAQRGPGNAGNTPRTNPQTNKSTDTNERWHWAAIIGCFIFGLWPIAVLLIILKVTGVLGDKNYTAQKDRVSQTAERFATRVNEVSKAAADAVDGAADEIRSTVQSARSPYASKPNYRMPEGFTTHEKKHAQEAAAAGQYRMSRENPAPQEKELTEKQRRRADAKAKGLGNVGLFKGLGIGIASVFGLSSVINIAELIATPSSLMMQLSLLLTLLCFTGVGVVLWGIGTNRKHKYKRYLQYLAMIGNMDRVSISAVAKTVGRSERKVLRDFEDMLQRGYFENAYIDHSRGELVLSGWNPESDPEQAQETTDAEAQENTAVRTIRQIRSLNNDIADPVMSEKIDRIEALTARIFRLLDEHPEKEGELRSFMSYYLPETLKLLDRYAKLEAQGVEGENISSAMSQIEGMMDKVADGFEAQLDKLFENDAMDISADLKVMEQMLQKDGLAAEELPF